MVTERDTIWIAIVLDSAATASVVNVPRLPLAGNATLESLDLDYNLLEDDDALVLAKTARTAEKPERWKVARALESGGVGCYPVFGPGLAV